MPGSLPLHTSRLVVRMMRPDDAAVHTAYRNDPDIARHQLWELPYPLDDAVSKLTEQQGQDDLIVGGWTTMAIELDGEVIGDIVTNIDETGGTAEIGFTLAKHHHGHGYASEAAREVTEQLFRRIGVGRVYGELDPVNVASARVLESAGLALEGVTKRSFLWRGEWTDNMSYAATRDEYEDWMARPTGTPSEVRLVEVESSTAHDWTKLAAHGSESRFVATVAQSFTDALFPEVVDGAPVQPWLRGVLADGERAGFVMTAEVTEHHTEPYLWRLLVDRRHQRRGIGRRVVEQLIERYRAAGHPSLLVGWVGGPGSPRRFYEQLGFVPTGEIVDGEIEARLPL